MLCVTIDNFESVTKLASTFWRKALVPYTIVGTCMVNRIPSKQTGEISVASEEETMIEMMVMDAAGPYFNWYTPEESPNAKAKAFYEGR